MILPLQALQPDDAGWIDELDGDERLVHRLAEMGVRKGARIRMVRTGSPCIIQVNEQRFSLRVDDALLILVELDAARVLGASS